MSDSTRSKTSHRAHECFPPCPTLLLLLRSFTLPLACSKAGISPTQLFVKGMHRATRAFTAFNPWRTVTGMAGPPYVAGGGRGARVLPILFPRG